MVLPLSLLLSLGGSTLAVVQHIRGKVIMRSLDYKPNINYEVTDHEPILYMDKDQSTGAYDITIATPEKMWDMVTYINSVLIDIKKIIDQKLSNVLLFADTKDMEKIKASYGDGSEEGRLTFTTFKKLIEDMGSDPRKKALFDSVMKRNNSLASGYTELDRFFLVTDLEDELYNVVDFIKGSTFNLIDPNYGKSTSDQIFTKNVLKSIQKIEEDLYKEIQKKIIKKDELYEKTLVDNNAVSDYEAATIDLYFSYDTLKTIEDTKRIAIGKLQEIQKEGTNIYKSVTLPTSKYFTATPQEILGGIASSGNVTEIMPYMDIMLETYYEKSPDDSVKSINKIKSFGTSVRDMAKEQAILHAQYRTKVISNTMKWTYTTGGEDVSNDDPSNSKNFNTPFEEILDIISEAGIIAERKYMKAMMDYEKLTTLSGKARKSYENRLAEKDKTKTLYLAMKMVGAQEGSQDLGLWAKTITEIL